MIKYVIHIGGYTKPTEACHCCLNDSTEMGRGVNPPHHHHFKLQVSVVRPECHLLSIIRVNLNTEKCILDIPRREPLGPSGYVSQYVINAGKWENVQLRLLINLPHVGAQAIKCGDLSLVRRVKHSLHGLITML